MIYNKIIDALRCSFQFETNTSFKIMISIQATAYNGNNHTIK